MAKQSNQTQLALIQQDIAYIKEQIRHIDTQVSSNYVTKPEFEPVRKLVFGLVGLMLIALVGAILKLVIK